tara:strand:- start:146 stop:463 length:318 start_codon:yes stop_codon:yes gene_type:complete
MDKSFLIIVISVAVIGFSASAYIFSENKIIDNVGLVDSFSSDRMEYINKINNCINENRAADDSITLNSFSAGLLNDLRERAAKAETVDELEFILDQVYKTTSCKP